MIRGGTKDFSRSSISQYRATVWEELARELPQQRRERHSLAPWVNAVMGKTATTNNSYSHNSMSRKPFEVVQIYIKPPNAVQPGYFTLISQRHNPNQTQINEALRPCDPSAMHKVLKQLRRLLRVNG